MNYTALRLLIYSEDSAGCIATSVFARDSIYQKGGLEIFQKIHEIYETFKLENFIPHL